MAERKRAVKTRRREKKNVPQGHVHIQATFNNTISTVEVGDRDDRVVERGLDMNVPLRDVLLLTPTCLDCSLAFRHSSVLRHFLRLTPTVFFGPRRWRALVLVRWPRTGRLRRWRRPRYEPISMRRLMLRATSRRRSPSTL